MAGEQLTTIGEFCPFIYGKNLPEGTRNVFGIFPVYGSNGIVGFHDKPLTNIFHFLLGRNIIGCPLNDNQGGVSEEKSECFQQRPPGRRRIFCLTYTQSMIYEIQDHSG